MVALTPTLLWAATSSFLLVPSPTTPTTTRRLSHQMILHDAASHQPQFPGKRKVPTAEHLTSRVTDEHLTSRATDRRLPQAERAAGAWHELYTSDEVRSTLRSLATADRGTTVLLYGARYCRACHSLQPKLRSIAARRPDIQFYRVNHSSATHDAVMESGVKHVPTLVFKDGDDETQMILTADSLKWLELRLQQDDAEPAVWAHEIVGWSI